MFDGTIQTAGLDLFSKHHVSEGIAEIREMTGKPRLIKLKSF